MQKHVRDELAQELPLLWLLLDTKARWSSLFSMLARFYLICNAVRKALVDLNSSTKAYVNCSYRRWVWGPTHNVVHTLQVALVKFTVKVLCRLDSNHLSLHWGSCWTNWERRRLLLVLNWLIHFPDVFTNVGTIWAESCFAYRIQKQGEHDKGSNLFSVPTTAEIRKIDKGLVEMLDYRYPNGCMLSIPKSQSRLQYRLTNSIAGSQECKPTARRQLYHQAFSFETGHFWPV